ncbi:MerR family transcriptional regulator [Paenibacillus sp. J2TS4]|uniref:MerR family transcriptional regulator n=1 Tax=Paenibacillus sp. J2TS4 TaxID=2807194 RepID=UPI001B1CC05D|nr:MerR family transcriptional regulator [Paenibacillus sp. J2TS4]GIP31785.1 MerR family transcriptional regulator [Paenibacillus sp. J2TS4]
MRLISIKEVKNQTGITVRTMRYYDQIGLLAPSAKSEGGHRLYSEQDLQKLQQIQFLKTMGFSLDEIKEMISDPDWNWLASLKNQLAYVLKEQDKLKQMESSLHGLIHTIIAEGDEFSGAIQQLIRLSSLDKKIKHDFRSRMFEEQEREWLKLLPNINSNDPDSLEWMGLLGQVKRHIHEGPDSPRIQRIIRRMNEKMEDTFAEADSFLEKMWEIRKSPEQSEQMGLYPIDQKLLDFVEKAWEIHIARGESHDSQDEPS